MSSSDPSFSSATTGATPAAADPAAAGAATAPPAGTEDTLETRVHDLFCIQLIDNLVQALIFGLDSYTPPNGLGGGAGVATEHRQEVSGHVTHF